MSIEVKSSFAEDLEIILDVHGQAFGGDESIKTLVTDLFDDSTARPLFSLLARREDRPVGHAFFSAVTIEGAETGIKAALLAPLAVVPDVQGQEIGVSIGWEGFTVLEEHGYDLVFVLGHPEYYPRLGFLPAGQFGFEAPYPIPEKNADAWMVFAFDSITLVEASGKIRCAESLMKAEYWRE